MHYFLLNIIWRLSNSADTSRTFINQTDSRSFVPPVRDEESETQRKAHAKRVRETRRSTQGVTLDEIKSAEQLVKKKTGNGTTESHSPVSLKKEEPPIPSDNGAVRLDYLDYLGVGCDGLGSVERRITLASMSSLKIKLPGIGEPLKLEYAVIAEKSKKFTTCTLYDTYRFIAACNVCSSAGAADGLRLVSHYGPHSCRIKKIGNK